MCVWLTASTDDRVLLWEPSGTVAHAVKESVSGFWSWHYFICSHCVSWTEVQLLGSWKHSRCFQGFWVWNPAECPREPSQEDPDQMNHPADRRLSQASFNKHDMSNLRLALTVCSIQNESEPPRFLVLFTREGQKVCEIYRCTHLRLWGLGRHWKTCTSPWGDQDHPGHHQTCEGLSCTSDRSG